MAWTIESALDDGDITLVERDDYFGVYRYQVGTLSTVIKVVLRRMPQTDEAVYTSSHSIHTPAQIGPYHPSRFAWDDVPYALHTAISSITEYYRQAVREGHKPSEKWLIPNG